MAALSNPFPILNTDLSDTESRELLNRESSNELIFAVVGHAGSGTTVVARTLSALLADTSGGNEPFDVVMIRARDVITKWASGRGKPLPHQRDKRYLSDVEVLQNYGDEMRAETSADGKSDHTAVARGLIDLIQEARAQQTGAPYTPGTPVQPDGKPRTYILGKSGPSGKSGRSTGIPRISVKPCFHGS